MKLAAAALVAAVLGTAYIEATGIATALQLYLHSIGL